MKVIVPIGISGSGKTTFYNKVFKDKGFVHICMDNINEQVNGDISGRGNSEEVFRRFLKMIYHCIDNNIDFYCDMTNVRKKSRKQFIKRFKNNPDVEIIYYVFPADIELSNERIQNDLKNKVNRCKVPYDVLENQLKMYNESIKTIEDEDVKEIIYLTKDFLTCTQ